MVLQVITPQQETFDLPISLPKTYLGKKVHCIFYIEEEATNVMLPLFLLKNHLIFLVF
jgi:hypothetical protein